MVHGEDLALAAACLRGDPRALAAFEDQFAPALAAALRTIDSSASFVDEMMQRLRHHLFVATPAAPPRLSTYVGAGPLAAWLRVTVLRIALQARRKVRAEVPLEDQLATVADRLGSPEQELAHRQYAAELHQALRAAIAVLPARMRTLLRYYYVEHAGVAELGRIYRVNASTISRWLAQTREQILTVTRSKLAQALGRDESDVESLLGLARSLDVSLHSLLRTQA